MLVNYRTIATMKLGIHRNAQSSKLICFFFSFPNNNIKSMKKKKCQKGMHTENNFRNRFVYCWVSDMALMSNRSNFEKTTVLQNVNHRTDNSQYTAHTHSILSWKFYRCLRLSREILCMAIFNCFFNADCLRKYGTCIA